MAPRTEADNSNQRRGTRQSLIDAARTLVFERGHERISIQDITRLAGVGTGTFYNYFDTKQRVFEAVLDDYRQAFADDLEQTRIRLNDPAMLVATTLKYYFHQAQHNEQWKTFLACSGLSEGHQLRQAEEQSLNDLRKGVKAGRFKIEDVHFAQSLIAGMIDHTNAAIGAGQLSPSASDNTVRYILRMLGLSDMVARALTQSPQPPVPVSSTRRLLPVDLAPPRPTPAVR